MYVLLNVLSALEGTELDFYFSCHRNKVNNSTFSKQCAEEQTDERTDGRRMDGWVVILHPLVISGRWEVDNLKRLCAIGLVYD